MAALCAGPTITGQSETVSRPQPPITIMAKETAAETAAETEAEAVAEPDQN